MKGLGPGVLPLLLAHLGGKLVPMFIEAGDDEGARSLLWRLAERGGLGPGLRMEAATACAGLPRRREEPVRWHRDERRHRLEHPDVSPEQAVEAADSAAARAALDLAVLQKSPEPDDEAVSQRLAELHDAR